MKRAWMVILGSLLAGWAGADVAIKQLDLTGGIKADALGLQMDFEAEVKDAPARLLVLEGAVMPTETELPRGAELVLEQGTYYIEFNKNGAHEISIGFEAKVTREGQLRKAAFLLPAATIRHLTLETDEAGYTVEVTGAPEPRKISEKKIQAFLPASGLVQLQWSPKVEKLSGELVATCESKLVAIAKVGTLQLQGQYTYGIPQGQLKNLAIKLPDGLNVVQVNGADLLAWNVRGEAGERMLQVELSRPQEKSYRLTLQAEQSLPEFPCAFEFPALEPQSVIRANGVVLVGTDSTIKLLVNEQGGLTQIEPDAVGWDALAMPKRGLYAYMFASMPFSMELSGDHIVTSLHAQDQLVLALSENELSLEAKLDLEVRDAPARDIEIEVSNDWNVTGVNGKNVADHDVRDRDGARWIKVHFKTAVDSRTLVEVRLEKTLAEDAAEFPMPRFRLAGAKSERGFLVLRGEAGTRMEGAQLQELRPVNTGSLPVRIADARQAFRFKQPAWAGSVRILQEQSSIHAESFQLVSLGESGVFGSCLITYNIANAPTRSFELNIPESYRNIEIHGRDIRNWTQEGERWTVHLQQKAMGDYTLLVTYDHPAKYQGEELLVGGIEAVGIENEAGYIALAGSANLSLAEEVSCASAVLPIDVDEVPEEYALLVNDPVMHAYKYVAVPHAAKVRIKRFAIQPLLTQVADHIKLDTTIGEEGEAVTLAVYHVKNTDRQFLPVRLPDAATLWTVTVNDRKVQVLDKGDGQMLVPVERRRDPNSPLKVAITYAEQLNEPGLFTRMKFESPQADTQSVFARWTFQLPDGQRLIAAKGNMELPSELSQQKVAWGSLAGRAGGGTILFWLGVVATLCVGLFFRGRNQGKNHEFSFVNFMLGCALVAASLAAVVLLASASLALLGSYGSQPSDWAFSKAVAGVDGGLAVQLTLANANFEALKNILLLVVGLVPLAGMLIAGKRGWLAPFFAVLVVVYSFSPYLAWIALVLPHLFLFALCHRLGKRRATDPEPTLQPLLGVESKEGSAHPALLCMAAGLMIAVSACVATEPVRQVAPASAEKEAVKAESVELHIAVPEFETKKQVNVQVRAELELKLEKGDEYRLLAPEFILMDYELSSRHLEVEATADGTLLRARKSGSYGVSMEYVVVAASEGGMWSVPLWIPAGLKNQATVELPSEGWNVFAGQDGAVRIRQEGARADILFGNRSSRCRLVWMPEERKTDLEQSKFFCDVDTFVDCRPGMVGLRHHARFNIAQGELQRFLLEVPDGMSITEVQGNDIGTWRFDPLSRLLEVVLSAPVTKAYEMRIGAQISREKLPYSVEIQGLKVRDAAMQRGVVAIAASDAVQVDVGAANDLSAINTSDAAQLLKGAVDTSIKRAYRYNRLPFAAQVTARQVLPELRLDEQTGLDISTEQLRLSSRLNVTVSKSGIFAVRLRIPEGFDVDSLSGEGISHWDEVGGAARELVVNFSRQISGTIPLNLVLSRSGRDLEPQFAVPRIRMEGVLKHTGTLAITVERGIRIATQTREGASEILPRELGIRQTGSLAFRLLRPDWTIELQSEVMDPKIKAEVLQRVVLSEGLMKIRSYLQFDIEHAGVKTFRLQPPDPTIALVVSGRNISRVRKVDDARGIWEVELHGKVEEQYGMEVAYQLPFAHDMSAVEIRPLLTLGTESQKGYVTVLSSGRLQVAPFGISASLRPEDARSIPRRFGAGDLSAAVLCYRATERDFEFGLNIVRHDAADVLPAQVQSVRIDSVITKDDQSLNKMTMQLDPGALRFLEMRLPEGAKIWSVFVNETAVRPLVENGLFFIPVEAGADPAATVEVVYAQNRAADEVKRKHRFLGPQFNLPLRDVRWMFYGPQGYRYSGFDGTLQPQTAAVGMIGPLSIASKFDEKVYMEYNAGNSVRFGANARDNIVKGNEYMQSGDQRGARKAFEKAIAYSQGQQDLNEDARVQFRNLVRQQGVMGLVNRRNQLKQSLNLMDQGEVQVPAGNEQWSAQDVQNVEAQLGDKESSTLSGLAETMLDQQQAASVEVHPIRVVMALQGSPLRFERKLQLQPDSEMWVEFNSTPVGASYSVQAVVVGAAALVILLAGGMSAKLRRSAASAR
ncbi:hypothetical protein [Pontiella sp.]|uniref:hypothetical protein n=1 Tax=Pontiella sp. TaxID=2837462 RepID=UPI003569F81A